MTNDMTIFSLSFSLETPLIFSLGVLISESNPRWRMYPACGGTVCGHGEACRRARGVRARRLRLRLRREHASGRIGVAVFAVFVERLR